MDEYVSGVRKVIISRSANRNGGHRAIFFGLIESTREKRNIVSKYSTISHRNFRKIIDTVFTRLNAAAFIKFLAFPVRRLFKGGV